MEPVIEVSQDALDEFKAIYQEEYGESLSDNEAREIATRVLRLFYILLRTPISVSADISGPRPS